jgi:uncharacterized oligopeptide transporter (OPT) family protein
VDNYYLSAIDCMQSDSVTTTETPPPRTRRFLPKIGSPAYHVMLSLVAIFILGPLGGISAAFMNFSIGFFIGGQVLAGILGSTVTLPYGPEGKHGANYMQTMAASVAGLCGMGVLLQAMVWLGLPEPPAWKMVLYMVSIGMFGAGVGMLFTPLLVDRMQLTFPSGFAVANILRALTDKNLLKRSIAKLGGGMLTGFGGGLAALLVPSVEQISFSPSTIGAGMIVGARIAIPAFVVGLTGKLLTPYLVSIHWLEEGETYRKIGFIIALGSILGAAIVDILLIMFQAVQRYRQHAAERVVEKEDWQRVNTWRLVIWVLFWGVAAILTGHLVMEQPLRFLAIATGLAFLFVLVNGISLGISDWNPLSSAFFATIIFLGSLGLGDPRTGLFCAAIVFVACNVGGDMQQDRSTGWRLGTNRVVQFRYQVIGVLMGAVLSVMLAKFFMSAYPVLRENQFLHKGIGGEKWQSAMTFKIVGALEAITHPKPQIIMALKLGIAIGLGIEIIRKSMKRTEWYKRFVRTSRMGPPTDFVIDAVLLPSPYASSFGGIVEMPYIYWWTIGGVGGSLFEVAQKKLSLGKKMAEGELPADMSTTSLSGGGLIAGESLASLAVGIAKLAHTLF